jgi:CRP-like cAMP-binding protein
VSEEHATVDPAHDHRTALSQVAIFASVPVAELDAIAALGCEIEVDAGRVLVRAGEVTPDLAVVLAGQAAVLETDGQPEPDARELGRGDLVGAAVADEVEPRSIEARSAMRLLVISRSRLAARERSGA